MKPKQKKQRRKKIMNDKTLQDIIEVLGNWVVCEKIDDFIPDHLKDNSSQIVIPTVAQKHNLGRVVAKGPGAYAPSTGNFIPANNTNVGDVIEMGEFVKPYPINGKTYWLVKDWDVIIKYKTND